MSELYTTACLFRFGRTNTDDLVSAAHRLLNAGHYSQATVELAYLTDNARFEAERLFPIVCADFGVRIPIYREAVRYFLLKEMSALASGAGDLRGHLEEIRSIFDRAIYEGGNLGDVLDVFDPFMSAYYWANDLLDNSSWMGVQDGAGNMLYGEAAEAYARRELQQLAREWTAQLGGRESGAAEGPESPAGQDAR